MGVYIVTGRRVASGGNSLDNLCIAVAVGWLVQSLFLGVPAVSHVIHPKSDVTWALAPDRPWKLLALLFVISLMASFIPYAVEQITLRRTPRERSRSCSQSTPRWPWLWDWRLARFQTPVRLLASHW